MIGRVSVVFCVDICFSSTELDIILVDDDIVRSVAMVRAFELVMPGIELL
mgnify:CR=1 FL=1